MGHANFVGTQEAVTDQLTRNNLVNIQTYLGGLANAATHNNTTDVATITDILDTNHQLLAQVATLTNAIKLTMLPCGDSTPVISGLALAGTMPTQIMDPHDHMNDSATTSKPKTPWYTAGHMGI